MRGARRSVRGQVILLTALIIAVAVLAVLLLQSATSASPGYGGVRAAYGVFSRDVSKAVEALSSYVDYMGVITLLNYSRSSALYALPAAANAELYSRWLHVNKTAQAANASAAFFALNRGALGLSVLLPSGFSYDNGWVLLSVPRYFYAAAYLRPVPNGTSGLPARLYVSGFLIPLNNFQLITAFRNATAAYRVGVVMNVSLLALAGLNITSETWVRARFLPPGGDCDYCINITTSKPYGWTAYFKVLNETFMGTSLVYVEVPVSAKIVNYTQYSAVYQLEWKNFVEPVVVAYIGNIPLYLWPTDPDLRCVKTSSGKASVVNLGQMPAVLYNTTTAAVAPFVGNSVVRMDFSWRNWRATYWVVRANGYLNLTTTQTTSLDACLSTAGLKRLR